jgi:hypothetical protein
MKSFRVAGDSTLAVALFADVTNSRYFSPLLASLFVLLSTIRRVA